MKLTKYKFDELYAMSSGISSKKEQAGHGSPFLSFSTIFNNYFVPDELIDLMDTSDKQKEASSIREGDIFLTRTSETLDELAMSCVALKDYPDATFNGFAKRLRPIQNNITYAKFMGFFLRSDYFRKTIDNNAIMTLRASFNENIFSYIYVELPDYDTQVMIGDLLYQIERKIQLNHNINLELEKMAKTIYDYWFVQFDYPDENGNPYKSSGGKMIWSEELNREIPDGWSSTKVKKLFEKTPKSSKVKNADYLQNGEFPIIDQSKAIIAGYTNDENLCVQSSEPLIIFGDHTRVLKYVNFRFARGADGTQLILAKNGLISPICLYQSLKTIDLSNYGYARHFKFLKDSDVVLPDVNISLKYDEALRDTYEMIRINIFESLELERVRNFLLPMLMNGQVTNSN